MKLERKLESWKQAGLIDSATADRIRAHESGSSRPILLWAVGGIGAFAIALGIVSIVAANWAEISDFVKLGCALTLGCALAASLYGVLGLGAGRKSGPTASADRRWLVEPLVIVYYGYALAALALVGQIYQLGGTAGSLLVYWTVGTAGLVFLGRGRMIALLFFLGLLSTYHVNLIEWFEAAPKTDRGEEKLAVDVLVFLGGVSPLVFLLLSRALAHIPALQRDRSSFAAVFASGSWAMLAILGITTQLLWYVEVESDDLPQRAVWAALAAGVVVAALIPRIHPEQSSRTQLGMRLTILAVYGMGALGGGIGHPELPLLGALLDLAFLCLLAWTALQAGSRSVFNQLTALVGLRLVVIYFEVFGSLLQTGLGLIGGGMLSLLIAWIWLRKSNALAEQLTEGPGQ